MQFTNNFKRDNNSFITVDIDTNFSNITTELQNMQLSNEYIAHVFADKIKQNAILENFEFKNQGDDFVISMKNNSLNDDNLRYLSQFIKPYKGKKNIYSAKLEDSYKLSNSLLNVGSNEPIGIYERRGLEDRIDIIISP